MVGETFKRNEPNGMNLPIPKGATGGRNNERGFVSIADLREIDLAMVAEGCVIWGWDVTGLCIEGVCIHEPIRDAGISLEILKTGTYLIRRRRSLSLATCYDEKSFLQ